MVKVLLVDNHDPVRKCILRFLAYDSRIEVIGEAAGYSEGLEVAQTTRPDVLILDLHIPREPGLSTSAMRAQLRSSGAQILSISFANDDETKTLANSVGAVELLDKMTLGTELIPAIMRAGAAGNHVPPPSLAAEARRSELR